MFRKTHRFLRVFSGLSGMTWNASGIHTGWLKGKLLALFKTLTLSSPLGSCSGTCCIGSAKPPGHWNHFFVTWGFLGARNVIQASSLWLRKIVSAAHRIPDLNTTSIWAMPRVADVGAWLLDVWTTQCYEAWFILSGLRAKVCKTIWEKKSCQSNVTVRKRSGAMYACPCAHESGVYGFVCLRMDIATQDSDGRRQAIWKMETSA